MERLDERDIKHKDRIALQIDIYGEMVIEMLIMNSSRLKRKTASHFLVELSTKRSPVR